MALDRLIRVCLILALAVLAAPVFGQPPRIVEIRIVGNDTTRDQVVLRELALQIGDPADPQRIEASRQSVQDLGLFRDVSLITEASGDGVALIVRVREKRYLLPIPRIDTSSDLDYTYGAQLRWANVAGLNHRMIAYVEQTHYKSDRNRDSSRSARISYSAPYIADSRYGLGLLADHTEQETLNRDDEPFDETFNRLEVLLTRDFRDSRPRRGWVLGGGLYWHDQKARGEFAPASDGMATALVGTADFSDLRFNVHSDSGRVFNARAEVAFDGLASDYSYERLDLNYREQLPFGHRPHQQIHWRAAAGFISGGPRSRNDYSLGGSRRMRGYSSDAIEGSRYWYLSGEYLRPIRWDWLRLLVLAEVGSAGNNVFGERNRSVYANIGVGLRARVTWFVDIELEMGVAMPLIAGGGARFFASGL